MGSTGSGNFSDYSNISSNGGNSGGTSGSDVCLKAFTTDLEDVERCDYYQTNKSLPAIGSEVSIYKQKRLVVISSRNQIIGFLPTKYNYLAGCIEDGKSYKGVITNIKSSPLIGVTVDIAPY